MHHARASSWSITDDGAGGTVLVLAMSRATTRIMLPLAAIALAGLVWSLIAYAPVPTAACILAAAVLFYHAAGRRMAVLLAMLALGGGVFGAAFHTTRGFFWLNRHRLDALVVQIAATPAITSLEIGQDRAKQDGIPAFDDYRFVNDTLITHDPAQADPKASQPKFYVGDLLRRLRVPVARYNALYASIDRLSLAGYARRPDGQIELFERLPGGTPWGESFVYGPHGGSPTGAIGGEEIRLAPHWYHVLQ
jgi:hypothetical protein